MVRLVLRTGQTLFLAIAVTFLIGASMRADDSAGVYKTKCMSCHAADGSGSAVGKKLGAHDFRSPDVQKESDDALAGVIAKGKNKMPAYEKSLKPEDIKGLVAYIRALAKKK